MTSFLALWLIEQYKENRKKYKKELYDISIFYDDLLAMISSWEEKDVLVLLVATVSPCLEQRPRNHILVDFIYFVCWLSVLLLFPLLNLLFWKLLFMLVCFMCLSYYNCLYYCFVNVYYMTFVCMHSVAIYVPYVGYKSSRTLMLYCSNELADLK